MRATNDIACCLSSGDEVLLLLAGVAVSQLRFIWEVVFLIDSKPPRQQSVASRRVSMRTGWFVRDLFFVGIVLLLL